MNPIKLQVLLIVSSCLSQMANAAGPGVSNVFDQFSGTTISSNFDPPESNNWVSGSFFGLAPNSGSQYFESDNGNFNFDFLGLHYAKQLGGTIANESYNVSFFIAANALGGEGMSAVQYSDFSELAIGGAAGTMVWLSTPTPGVGQGWVQWSGIYTPSLGDVGTPFQFRMTVDIDRRHSLAIDGLMMAVVPEPSCAILIGLATICLPLSRTLRVSTRTIGRLSNWQKTITQCAL
jgi:hypothetical protein